MTLIDRPVRVPRLPLGPGRGWRSLTVVTLIAAVVAEGPAALASGPELLGFGLRSPAMAGTGASFADNYEAVYANPAGMALSPHRRLTLGYVVGAYHLTLDGNPHASDNTSALVLGAELPLPLGGFLRDRLAIGLGFHLPTNVVNRARDPFPDVPTLLLDNRTQTVSVMAVLAARLPGHLSIGGGVIALAALLGGIDLLGSAGGHFGASSEEQLVASYAPLLGARWDAGEQLHVGATYRGESVSRYDLAVTNHLGAALPFDLPTLHFAGVSNYDPHTVAIEASLGRSRGAARLVALQLQWQHWSAMPPLVNPVTPASPAPPPPGLRDTVNVRLGCEWLVDDSQSPQARLRGGYAFVMSPAPDASPTRTILDAHRHVVSAGLELTWNQPGQGATPIHLELFYQLNVLQQSARSGGWFGVLGLSLGAEL